MTVHEYIDQYKNAKTQEDFEALSALHDNNVGADWTEEDKALVEEAFEQSRIRYIKIREQIDAVLKELGLDSK
jgi:hypothetical protein